MRYLIDQEPSTGNVECLILESFATDDPTQLHPSGGPGLCEKLGRGYCTLGAAPCRREHIGLPPVSPEEAAYQLSLKIMIENADGVALDEAVQAHAEGVNAFVQSATPGRGGAPQAKHLVCEMLQLAGGRVPPAETEACLNDPTYGEPSLGGALPSTGGGWCYTTNAAIVGEGCRRNRAAGKIRFLGDTVQHLNSEIHTICGFGC